MKNFARGLLWLTVSLAFLFGSACFMWAGMGETPMEEYHLIRFGKIAPGELIEAWEEEESYFYVYTTPDGTARKSMKSRDGRLRDGLQVPELIEVEYLQSNPEVSRIKGNGSQTIAGWVIRSVLLRGLLFLMFLACSVPLFRVSYRTMKGLPAVQD